MLINFKLLIAIAAVVSIGIAYLLFRLTSKNKKYVRGGFFAFFAILFVFTGIVMMNSRAYIVKSKTDFSNCAVYGSPEYTMGNGTKLSLKIPMQQCLIVNDSPEDLVIEKVVYSSSGFSNAKDIFVAQGTSTVVNTMRMNYLFDEAPPKQIKTKNTGKEVHFWLRTKKDYEADYGPSLSTDQVERLRDALKKRQTE